MRARVAMSTACTPSAAAISVGRFMTRARDDDDDDCSARAFVVGY
jgi:hypothetical protein